MSSPQRVRQRVGLGAARAGFAAVGRVAPEPAARRALRLAVTPRRYPLRPWEESLLARSEPVPLASGLSAVSWGRGPAVLLVHGWSGRGTQLGAFVDPLVATGHRVIALDGPAHGHSPGEDTDAVRFAAALVETGRELGPLAGVIAHSFGAAATVRALTGGLDARRVVLVAAPASMEVVLERFAARLNLPPRTTRRFLDLIGERAEVPLAELDTSRVAAGLERIPALVLHAPDDDEVPFADGQAIAAAWPGAELISADGMGHRRVLRDSAMVAEVVRFLAPQGAEREAA